MPLGHILPRLAEHLTPVFDLVRSALAAQKQLTNRLVAAAPVEVHDRYEQGRVPDLVEGHLEGQGLFENRIQGLLFD